MVMTYSHNQITINEDDSSSYITTQQYRDNYATDAPVFDRNVLVQLQRQLDERAPEVVITAFSGATRSYDMTPASLRQCETDRPSDGKEWRRAPRYAAIQTLIKSGEGQFPVQIMTCSDGTDNPDPPLPETIVKVKERYEQNRGLWEQSVTCSAFLTALDARKLPRISRIVCFGLGPLNSGASRGTRRYHTQHALVETLRQYLHRTQPDVEVKVTCQDPVYGEVDKKILEDLNMDTAEDPATFLQIDGETVVYTVSPNICVRQVTADMPRPAAMIWNTVPPTTEQDVKKQEEDYKRLKARYTDMCGKAPSFEVIDDEIVTSVGHTDPSSRRVRAMIKEYQAWAFPEDDSFPDVTLYTRNQL